MRGTIIALLQAYADRGDALAAAMLLQREASGVCDALCDALWVPDVVHELCADRQRLMEQVIASRHRLPTLVHIDGQSMIVDDIEQRPAIAEAFPGCEFTDPPRMHDHKPEEETA